MYKVTGSKSPIKLEIFAVFQNVLSDSKFWRISNLEYWGEKYQGCEPLQIEVESKSGIEMSPSKMESFSKTVDQVIEGNFELRFESDQPNRSEPILIVEIFDGEIWQVGGAEFERFMDMNNLRMLP